MRIRNTIQKGLLICLYLAEKGRASVDVIGPALGEYPGQTLQVLNDLTSQGVLDRSKDGIYKLNGNPTVGQVYAAFVPTEPLKDSESKQYTQGDAAQRAVAFHARLVNNAMKPLFSKTIRGLHNDLHIQECNEMDSLPVGGSS